MSEGPMIFDRALIRRRQRRAMALGPATFLLDRVADDLSERLQAVLRQFDVVVDWGTPGQAVRAALVGLRSVGAVVATSAIPDLAIRKNHGERLVVADEEALPFRDASLDLVVSAL